MARVIHYPPLAKGSQYQATGSRAAAAAEMAEVDRSTQLSCGEHTDYGLLTLVNQESHIEALQVGVAVILVWGRGLNSWGGS